MGVCGINNWFGSVIPAPRVPKRPGRARNFALAVPLVQQFLFAPEKPLVKRLGKKFFRKAPEQAGVYKMRDAGGAIVYVGKARNLRKRLRSYRVANPERLAPRHLRLLRQVDHIEFELCRNESEALKREAALIRELKPRFNRAGVWQGRPRFLAWRFTPRAIELSVQETPGPGWERYGPLGAYAPRLRMILAHLLWLALKPASGFREMPHGWAQGALPDVLELDCGDRAGELREALVNAFWGDQAAFLNWLATQLNTDRPAFDKAAIAKGIEEVRDFLEQQNRPGKKSAQMALL